MEQWKQLAPVVKNNALDIYVKARVVQQYFGSYDNYKWPKSSFQVEQYTEPNE